MFNEADKRAFHKFRRTFVTSCADKAHQDFAFTCPVQYAKWIVHEVTRPGSAYQKTSLSEVEIINKLADFLTVTKIKVTIPTERKFAPLKSIIKYHKDDPPKMARFISASKGTYNSNLAIRLNKILGYLVPNFEGLWTRMLKRANAVDSSVPTNLSSWVAKDSTNIVDMFRMANKDIPKTQSHLLLASSYDFSTLYTTLPHDLICAAFDSLFDLVFAGHSFLAYNTSNAVDAGVFIDGPLKDPDNPRTDEHPKKGWRYIALSELKKSLSFLIRNTYVRVGDQLFWQWLGIPMGTNPAVHIANYFLFFYELAFMNRLIDLGKIATLKSLLRTKRYIDDLCQLASAEDSAAFKSMLVLEDFSFPGSHGMHGIYPRVLVCNEEQRPAHKGHCLDIDYYFETHTRRWHTDIYSKINDPKYRNLVWYRYPNIRTKLSSSCKYNIITSQVYRFFRLVSRKCAVVFHIATLVYTLHILRGYSLKTCWLYVNRAVSKFIPMWNVKSIRYMVSLIKKRYLRIVFEDKVPSPL